MDHRVTRDPSDLIHIRVVAAQQVWNGLTRAGKAQEAPRNRSWSPNAFPAAISTSL